MFKSTLFPGRSPGFTMPCSTRLANTSPTPLILQMPEPTRHAECQHGAPQHSPRNLLQPRFRMSAQLWRCCARLLVDGIFVARGLFGRTNLLRYHLEKVTTTDLSNDGLDKHDGAGSFQNLESTRMRWKRSSAHINSVTRDRIVPECKKVQAEGKRAVGSGQ